MRLTRTLPILLLTVLVGAVLAGRPAAAEDYPPAVKGTVSDSTVAPGGTVTFSGSGYTPFEEVVITVETSGGTTGAGPLSPPEARPQQRSADHEAYFATGDTLAYFPVPRATEFRTHADASG